MALATALATSVADGRPQTVATTTAIGITISVTNTFQQALASSARNSCLIQYTGGNTGFVYFGLTANATTANSIQLKAQQGVSCANVDGTVITDAVQVSGTSTDTFVVYQQ